MTEIRSSEPLVGNLVGGLWLYSKRGVVVGVTGHHHPSRSAYARIVVMALS
jgi:hypothetical protein